MNTPPLVTLAVPVYNGERYLGALLDAVRAQDHDRLEIIVADNASSDDTLRIARSAADDDERIRVLTAESNAGAAHNFNRCVAAARGEYFKWVAADDLIEPQFVSACLAVLEREPDVSLVYPRVVDIGPDGAVLHRWGPMVVADQPSAGERFADVLADPKRGFPVFGLVRRADLLRTSLIGGYTGSDLALIAEFAVIGRFVEVPGELFLHREHDERSTRAYEDYRDRTRWFDTSKSGRWSHPYWAQYRGYARAVTRARLSPSDYVRCAAALGRWGHRYHRYLGHEVKVSARQLVAGPRS